METLGTTLKAAREKLNLTLRDVDKATGISSAYISQLENDHVKNPSASVLYNLAEAYSLHMNDLLRAAGIIKAGSWDSGSTPTKGVDSGTNTEDEDLAKRIAFYAKNLSSDQQEELIAFIKMKIKLSNKNG
jgi:HTH-type transcriptional regulator, competence development regulator